jgi:hypothetical protein
MEITSDSERIRRQAALLNDCHQRILDLQAQNNAKDDTIARLRGLLETLVMECRTNDDFAVNPHGTEADALEAAQNELEQK